MKCSVCDTTDPSAFNRSTVNRKSWYCKKCSTERKSTRRIYYKKKAVLLMGGKCVRCGYDDNITALEFHHLHDKDSRLSDLCGRMSWKSIEQELTKCILLCACCHRDEHMPNGKNWKSDGFVSLSDSCRWNEYEPSVFLPLKVKRCPICQKEFKARRFNGNGYEQQCCSLKCSGLSRRVGRPSCEELRDMYSKMTQSAIAERFGVSDVAVSKWAKEYGLK